MKKIITLLLALLLSLTILTITQAQPNYYTTEQSTSTQTIQENYINLLQNRQTLRSKIQTLQTSLRNILSTQPRSNQPNTIDPQQTTIQQPLEPIRSTPLQQPLEPLTTTPTERPSIWNAPINTGYSHTYFIILSANPRVNNFSLQYGDWVGGFYLDDEGNKKCGGARMWTGTHSISLTLFGNSPYTTIKDGFSNGELIEFRVFLSSTQKEYIINDIEFLVEPYFVSNGRWYSMSISRIIDMASQISFDAYLTTTPNPICLGNSSQLNAHIFVESTGTYTYSWSSDPPGFTSTQQTPPPVSPTQTTIYKLNVSDGIRYSTHQLPLIVHVNPTVFAGADAVICENMNHQLQGSATNYSELLWTTFGDGSFSNPSIYNPVYTPGSQDKTNGQVSLTLTAVPLSPCTIAATDSMTLILEPLPQVDAGEDFSVCTNEEVIVNAEASHYSTLIWTTSGTGSFSHPTSVETIYYPSTQDTNAGSVSLTLTAFSISPCTPSVSDTVIITFIQGPKVNAPNLLRQCEDQSINIICYPTHYSSLLWTTPGDGYFEDPTQASTQYHPGPNDITNGGLFITVYAFGHGPCATPASKQIELELIRLPQANAGDTTIMNAEDLYIQLTGSATNYTTIQWTKIGDGFFTSLTNLNTRYYPGTSDRANGYFTVILTANPKQFCSTPGVDELTVTILNESLPPSMSLQPILNHSTMENQLYSYQVVFDEVDVTEPIIFTLPEKPTGMSISPSSGLIQWNPGFDDRGIHTVTVEASYTNYPDVSDMVSYELTVLYDIVDPIANFSYTPLQPIVNQEIEFSCLSYDPDGDIISRLWVFGDGSTSTEQYPTHIYTSKGIYSVSLTVTDNDSATDTITKEITIEKDDSNSTIVEYHLSKGVNFISFDFLPDSLVIEDIFAPISSSGDLIMIIADNAVGGYYMPAWNVNTLGNNGLVELYRGYRVIMNEAAVLSVSGEEYTQSVSLDLVKGANFISFKNETPVLDAVGDFFDDGSLSMIIDFSNSHNPPLYVRKIHTGVIIGNLELFQPGHIYLFIAHDAFSLPVS